LKALPVIDKPLLSKIKSGKRSDEEKFEVGVISSSKTSDNGKNSRT
jgi:hypothetical protein